MTAIELTDMKWISVKDSLPEIIEEDGQSELVLCVGHKGTHPDYVQYELMHWTELAKPDLLDSKGNPIRYGWSNRWWDKNPDLYEVSHWAKLTQPNI
jgi:hypothetical protein